MYVSNVGLIGIIWCSYVHAGNICPERSVIIKYRSCQLRNNNAEDVDEAGVGRIIEIIHVLNKKWQYNRVDEGHGG